MSLEEQVLEMGDTVDKLKHQKKGLTKHENSLKERIRKIMLKDLKIKEIRGEKVEIKIREKNSFKLNIFEEKYPELYKKYTRIESRIVTITEEEFIFDKEKFMKLNKEAYENCFKKGTPGVYITRLNT